MDKMRISSIWIDKDLIEWLDGKGSTLGKNRSERIRALLREGRDSLSNRITEGLTNAPGTDPPKYDLRAFLRVQQGLDESIKELKIKHADQVKLAKDLSRSIEKLRRRIADINHE